MRMVYPCVDACLDAYTRAVANAAPAVLQVPEAADDAAGPRPEPLPAPWDLRSTLQSGAARRGCEEYLRDKETRVK